MTPTVKNRQLFTLDKINSEWLDKYCKMIGTPKSTFLNSLLTELRSNSDFLFDNFLTDKDKISSVDGFMFLAQGMKKISEMQLELLDMQQSLLEKNVNVKVDFGEVEKCKK